MNATKPSVEGSNGDWFYGGRQAAHYILTGDGGFRAGRGDSEENREQ